MKHGDYTDLAKYYPWRPGYSKTVIDALLKYIGWSMRDGIAVADIGAGTGIFSKELAQKGISVIAVEPNASMRRLGMRFTKDLPVMWVEGKAEETGLRSHVVDWVVMASAFHWTDKPKALCEFHRILKPGGFVSIVWNPRDIEGSEIHQEVERIIYEEVPNIQRVSSGHGRYTEKWDEVLTSTGHFEDVIFMEARHFETMTKKRYLNIWRSVNDIRVQAGEDTWKRIFYRIKEILRQKQEPMLLPYKTRAWTAKRRD